jgi:RNA polymerase sigma-70 factor (ECF subfamily)
VLDPAVVLRSDGGGRVSAARRPVFGADAVARFVLGVLRKNPEVQVEPRLMSDGVVFAWQRAGRASGVLALRASSECITDVWIVMNPDKLRAWDSATR